MRQFRTYGSVQGCRVTGIPGQFSPAPRPIDALAYVRQYPSYSERLLAIALPSIVASRGG